MAWSDDRDGSAGYVVVTALASVIDEAIPFVYVKLSDLPADFHTAMSAASDTDGKTIRVSTADGNTQLACVPLGVNTGTDTGALFFLGTGMSASVDVDYRIYVGNAALSMPSASGGMGEQAVFADFAGLWLPGIDTRDFTAGGRNLTLTGTYTQGVTGPVEGLVAIDLDGSSGYGYHDGTPGVTDWPLTLIAIASIDNITTAGEMIALGNTGTGNYRARLIASGTTSGDPVRGLFLGTGSSSIAASTGSFSSGAWMYNATTRDDDTGTSTAYRDMANAGTDATTINAPTFNTMGIGVSKSNVLANYFNGQIAFGAVLSGVKSANWLLTFKKAFTDAFYSAGSWVPAASGVTGTGALTAPAGTVSSSGVVGKTGTGALTAPPATVSGAGTVTIEAGTTGWVDFQAAATSTLGADVDWVNASNALVNDSNFAVATIAADAFSEYLRLTDPDYGVTIPVGAPSYAVSFRFYRSRTTGSGGAIQDSNIQVIVGGSVTGSNLAETGVDWPTTSTVREIVDGVWGVTFAGTDFDTDFGIAVRALKATGGADRDAQVYFAQVKIDWEGTTSSATGSLVAPAGTVSGAGIAGKSGTGALTAPVATVSGAGVVTHSGEGALTAPAGVVSGAGITGRTGTGALTAPSGVASGAGITGVTGTGALTAPAGVIDGEGTGGGSGTNVTGTGALTAPAGIIAGSGYSYTGTTPGVDYISWYLTGASADGVSQRDQALSLGGYRSGVALRSMTWDCRDPMVGIEILGVGALNGRGSGSLSAVTEDSLSWTAPLGAEGTAVAIAVGEEKQIYGFGDSGWILVRRVSTLPLVGAHSVQCVDVFNNVIGFDNVPSADAVSGETYYRAIMGHNSFGGPITSLLLWLAQEAATYGLSIGFESAVGGAIQTIANETTAPTGITWVSGTTSATALELPPIAADGLFGIWLRRIVPADSDPTPSVLNHINVQFSDVSETKSDALRGRYRIARSDSVGYGVWLGQDAAPDLSTDPDEFFTSLPHTTALSYDADHVYQAVVRQRNKWGLWSQNNEPTMLPMDASGDAGYIAPSGPTLVTVTHNGDNEAIVGARYEPAVDGDNRGEIFVLWMTTDDSTPDPTDPPTGYGVMGAARVSRDDSTARTAIEAFRFTDTGNDLLDGTPVKAIVRVRRLAVAPGDAFSPDTTQLPASGAGSIVVASELAGWPSTGYLKVLSPSGKLQEAVEYSNLVIGTGISTFTVLSGGRALFGTTAAATTASCLIYPVVPTDSINADVAEGEIDGLEPGRPWGDLLFGTQAAQEQEPIAGPDGATKEFIDAGDNIYLLLGEGWTELWIDTVLVWKVFQDGNTLELNKVYIPDGWEIELAAVSGAGTGVFENTSATDLYIVAGGIRRVHIDASAMTITLPELVVDPVLPEVAPQVATWEQYAGSLLQSWDPERSDYRPYMQLTAAGVLTSQWDIETSFTQAEILAL